MRALEAERAARREASSGLMRLQVALETAPAGMAPARISSLAGRLRGTTKEELASDAAALFAEFAGVAPAGLQQPAPQQPPAGQVGAAGVQPQVPAVAVVPVSGQVPVEQLLPGALPIQQPVPLPQQIAAAEARGDWAAARTLKNMQLQELAKNTR